MFLNDLTVRRMIGSRNTWQLEQPLMWMCEKHSIVVPAGFVFDFASIPSLLTNILPKEGRAYDRASCLHDWCYTVQELSRRQADALFLKAMLEDGVNKMTARLMYRAVRLFGGKAWRNVSDEQKAKMRSFKGGK